MMGVIKSSGDTILSCPLKQGIMPWLNNTASADILKCFNTTTLTLNQEYV